MAWRLLVVWSDSESVCICKQDGIKIVDILYC